MSPETVSPDGYDRVRRNLFDTGEGTTPEDTFGRIAVDMGFVTPDQLEECARERDRLRGEGESLQLSQILLKRGYLSTTKYLELLDIRTVAARRGGTAESSPPAQMGRYRVVREIARGGMGRVYEAEDCELRRRVALKVLREDEANTGVIRRLHREASIVAQLRHPNIVTVHEVGTADATHFIAMEYIEGRTLADALREGKTDRADLLNILESVARAVAYAHSRGIVHRDLKPGNVLLETGGRAVLTDFGLARAETFETRLTQPRSVFGTPAYMAPEQVQGRTDEIGERTDVYALGVVMYEILTGAVPFETEQAHEMYHRILHVDPVRPGIRRPGTPAELEAVCMKAMEKEVARRYRTAAEFAEELRRWREGEPVEAKPAGWWNRLSRRIRRNPGAWLGMAAAAAAVLIGAVLVIVQAVRHARENQAREVFRDAQSFYNAAIVSLMAGDQKAGAGLMAQFEEKVVEAVALDPDFHGGWFERAQYARLVGDDERSWRCIDEGLRHDPENPLGRIEKGMLLAAEYRAALRRAREEKSLERQMPGMAFGRSSGDLIRADELEESDPELRRLRERAEDEIGAGAERLGSDLPWMRLARAELAYIQDRLDEAEKRLEELEYPAAKVIRGRIEERRDNLDLAEEWFTKAIHTHERYWDGWEARGALRRRKWSQAWDPKTGAGGALAEQSLEDWTRAVEGRPERVEARIGRAAALYALGLTLLYKGEDPKDLLLKALADTNLVLSGDRSHIEAHVWRIYAGKYLVYWQGMNQEDPTDAIGQVLDSCDFLIAAGRATELLHIDRGNSYRELGRWESRQGKSPADSFARSIEAYDASLALAPGSWIGLYGKGQVYMDAEEWAKALECFEKAREHTDGPSSGLDWYIQEARRKLGE